MFSLIALTLAAPASAQDGLTADARYRNQVTGLGYRELGGNPALAFRTFKVASSGAGQVFVRGADIDAAISTETDYALAARSYFGGNVSPAEDVRIAVYAGAGFSSTLVDIPELGLTSLGVSALVPLMAEVGVNLTDNVSVHARGGVNVVPWAFTLVSGDLVSGNAPSNVEFVVSAAVGGRDDDQRVRGLRVEAGRVHGAWSVLIGIGG